MQRITKRPSLDRSQIFTNITNRGNFREVFLRSPFNLCNPLPSFQHLIMTISPLDGAPFDPG